MFLFIILALLWFTAPTMPSLLLSRAGLVCASCVLYCTSCLSIVVWVFLQWHIFISQLVLAGSLLCELFWRTALNLFVLVLFVCATSKNNPHVTFCSGLLSFSLLLRRFLWRLLSISALILSSPLSSCRLTGPSLLRTWFFFLFVQQFIAGWSLGFLFIPWLLPESRFLDELTKTEACNAFLKTSQKLILNYTYLMTG